MELQTVLHLFQTVPEVGRCIEHATGKISWSCNFSTIPLSLNPPTILQPIHLSNTRFTQSSTTVRRPGLGADRVCITINQLFCILTITRPATLGMSRQGQATILYSLSFFFLVEICIKADWLMLIIIHDPLAGDRIGLHPCFRWRALSNILYYLLRSRI